MQTTRVFSESLKAYNSGYRWICNVGGTRSTKSYSVLQLLYLIAKHSKVRLDIAIVSKTLTHLKDGTMKDFEEILYAEGVEAVEVKNIAESLYTIGKSRIRFLGADNEGRVTGPKYDIVFLNEANFISEKVAEQLSIRTVKCLFADWNPSMDFWIDNPEYEGRDDLITIHSTYRDNKFLSDAQIHEIEERGRKNTHFKRVYMDGLKGRLEGAIYNNWTKGEFNDAIPYGYGLDFGFNDPDVLIRCAIDSKNNKLYLHEEFRDTSLSTNDLISKLKVCKTVIYADSAEPRLISDIKNSGVYIRAVKKGAGSIAAGISLVQGYDIIVTPESKRLIRELETYRWNDKKSGIPEDKNNHGLDAMRYYVRMLNLTTDYTISIY